MMRKIEKTSEEHFTKVMLKVILEPTNYPIGCSPTSIYQYTLEYRCPKNSINDLQNKYDIEGLITDFDELHSNLTENTDFACKTKRVTMNYESLEKQLGYAPDAIEFDQYLKKCLNQIIGKLKTKQVLDLEMVI